MSNVAVMEACNEWTAAREVQRRVFAANGPQNSHTELWRALPADVRPGRRLLRFHAAAG